jgi:hypothetical protein
MDHINALGGQNEDMKTFDMKHVKKRTPPGLPRVHRYIGQATIENSKFIAEISETPITNAMKNPIKRYTCIQLIISDQETNALPSVNAISISLPTWQP